MKVLIACESSGRVREAFRDKGHKAVSCDLKPTEIPGDHYQGDIRDLLNDSWDLMIAHPPCTHLAVCGAKHFKNKIQEQKDAVAFFMEIVKSPIKKYCIENPIGIMSTRYREPDQIIQPYYFGDPFQKSTCLWLRNLPRLHYSVNEDQFIDSLWTLSPEL